MPQALWERVEGEDDALAGTAAAGDAMDAEGDDGRNGDGTSAAGGADGDGASVLAGFVRRRCVSHWLQRQAKGLVEAELAGVNEPCEAVLRLLAAQQPAAAVAVRPALAAQCNVLKKGLHTLEV